MQSALVTVIKEVKNNVNSNKLKLHVNVTDKVKVDHRVDFTRKVGEVKRLLQTKVPGSKEETTEDCFHSRTNVSQI